jgi:hypothetical protein
VIGDHITAESWRSQAEDFGTDPTTYRCEWRERARLREQAARERRRRRRKAALLLATTSALCALVRWPDEASRALAGVAVLAAAGWATYQVLRFAQDVARGGRR